jgi:aerobic carbon-monoxide dehydrogenase small subunit
VSGGVLTIGALTRHVDLARSSEIAAHAPLLTEAIAHVAHPAIRNKGTIGGSLAHADPASELPACMVALKATIIVRGPAGERRIAAEDFFTGIYETVLSAQELLVAVELPVAQKNSAHFFFEFARRHGDYAIAGLAAQAVVEGEVFTELRPVFFAIGDRPVLAKAATKLVKTSITSAVLSGEGAAGALHQRASRSPRSQRRGICVTAHVAISLHVNGERVDADVLPRVHLADFLREHLKLTGTHVGCEHGVCGACTVRVNGDIVRSCLMLAVQTQGASVETIEGLSDSGEIADLQAAFRDRNALQCGFCTPGMLVAAQDLLKQNAEPDREQIREHLSGNYCRCTGYQAIVDAVETTARARRGRRP